MAGKDPRPRLQDIATEIEGIKKAIGDRSLVAFSQDWLLRRAVERSLEIISEASRHIPAPLREAEPAVPWNDIAGIGNILRHAYHRVEPEVIYTIVTGQLEPLFAAVRRLLDRLEDKEL